MSSQKLWVQHETTAKTYGPTQVPIKDCPFVDDFIKEIKKETQLAIPKDSAITLYQLKDGQEIEIDVGNSPADYVTGNSRKNPLIVKTTAPLTQFQPAALFSPCQILFYNKICNATENDGWISFEQDIPSSTLNRLFVRDSYQSIASSIQPGINKTIITGTPGIGKSLFLIYLLWKLVKAGKRVLFVYHPVTIYYDGQGGVFELTSLPSVVDHSFWTSDLWCLFDAKGKQESHISAFPYEWCTFVLSTSPRREMVNDFKKPPRPQVFYMPIWTDTELETISPCFSAVIDWHNRFKILGGIPRYVLEDSKYEPTKLLEAACKQCDLDDCIKIIGLDSTITDKSKVVHSLVHMTSEHPFTESSVKFASQAALDIIVEYKGTEAKRKMSELLASCAGNPLTAALCGYIFEPHAIDMLQKGGLFSPCQILFYNKICNATENDGWISFEQDIPSSTLNRLFVRDSYQSIASSIQPGINKTIITGTPGIGKSLFLIYLLWKLVKAGKRVLFVYHPVTIYYDGQGGVFELTSLPSVVDHSFWTSDLWCLFDAKGKQESHISAFPYEWCTFVLSTSPRREMVNDFKKPPRPQVFYMPIWTDTELETISPCFSAVIDWHNRFKILGGIPRYVLEDSKYEPTKLLEAACKQCDLDDCIKIIGLDSTITDKSKVVHSLVHMTSEHPFTESSVKFASQAALDIIVEYKGTEAKRKMSELLASCAGNPLTAALCGYIFEPHAIDMLQKGGDFKCHKLVHGNMKVKPAETTLKILPSVRVVVDKVEMNQTPNQLHQPKTKNFAAIDAWIPGIGAFQMTVGKTHDNIKGAEKDLAMLEKEANKLYWLLPPLYYHTFTKKTPQEIDQYALLIPNPTVEN